MVLFNHKQLRRPLTAVFANKNSNTVSPIDTPPHGVIWHY